MKNEYGNIGIGREALSVVTSGSGVGRVAIGLAHTGSLSFKSLRKTVTERDGTTAPPLLRSILIGMDCTVYIKEIYV